MTKPDLSQGKPPLNQGKPSLDQGKPALASGTLPDDRDVEIVGVVSRGAECLQVRGDDGTVATIEEPGGVALEPGQRVRLLVRALPLFEMTRCQQENPVRIVEARPLD